MKGQQIIIGGRRCDRCQKEISDLEYNRNVSYGPQGQALHYCNNCILQVQMQNLEIPTPGGGRQKRVMWIRCPHCGLDVNLHAISPKNLCPNCRYKINPTACPSCGSPIDKNAPSCWNCGWVNKSYIKTSTSLSEATAKKINVSKIYELMIYELAGVFVIFGLPFFGFPSLVYLGIVLMALFPFYSFLPNEREALNSRQQSVESLGSWAAGALLLKGAVKMLAFILTVLQFIVIPVSRLIPLAISFIYYFTLPVSYKVTQPFKMIEAWFRVGVGGLIAYFIFIAFAGSTQAWSLALMAAAFFVTSFPRHKEAPEEQGVVRVELLDKAGLKYLKGQMELPLKIIFLILMAAALVLSGVEPLIVASPIPAVVGGAASSSLQLIFLIVWLMSLFGGLATSSEGRPALGILMIGITLFVFSFTATGVIGQAVFGYWWPQVQSLGESVTAPLGPMLTQVQSTMSDSWLMLSNPMGYYNKMQQQQQATSSVVQSGGSVKSIELTKTDLFTSVSGQLEPQLDPLIGSFEIQNQGEFDASNIKLDLWASWKDPQSLTEETTGTLDSSKFSCSQPAQAPTFQTVEGGTVGACIWDSTTYPQEIKVVNFMFENDKTKSDAWSLGSSGNLANCVQEQATKCGPDTGDSTSCCGAGYPNATYVHSGQTVKVNVNITYDYNVNVSIPVDVINFTVYQNLLQSKEITLQELTSEYTGGPVKATLWSQRQPIRSGESSLFVASIYNDGQGEITKINSFTIKILKSIAPSATGVQKVSSTFYSDSIGNDACTDAVSTDDGAYWTITCSYDVTGHSIKSGEYARVSFLVTPDLNLQGLGGGSVDRISRLIIGLANYEYVKTASTSITIANNPLH